jgi:hypothetical protein
MPTIQQGFSMDCDHTGPKRNGVMYCRDYGELVTEEECQQCWADREMKKKLATKENKAVVEGSTG